MLKVRYRFRHKNTWLRLEDDLTLLPQARLETLPMCRLKYPLRNLPEVVEIMPFAGWLKWSSPISTYSPPQLVT